MALSAYTRPHFTTIASFISSLDKEVVHLFRDILLVCDQMGLIGKEMFAIDGCKLPSNASKEWSGTKAFLITSLIGQTEYTAKKSPRVLSLWVVRWYPLLDSRHCSLSLFDVMEKEQ